MSKLCAGQPISWLELEAHALGESSRAAAIDEHLQTCASCARIARGIEMDRRRLPALLVPAMPTRSRGLRWQWLLPLVPALALFLFFVASPDHESQGYEAIKGGDTSIELIREHAGEIVDASYFLPEDRFKVQVSCSPGRYRIFVSVTQDQEEFFPLPETLQHCGNKIILPGAFSLQGGPALVCVRIGNESAPACIELRPQPEP